MELRLKDVAELAKVSPGTVSRVVNGLERVKPETRGRVQEGIDSGTQGAGHPVVDYWGTRCRTTGSWTEGPTSSRRSPVRCLVR